METKRQRQVAELVKRNFSMVLQELGSYIYGSKPLVTVTEVKMSSDLGIARIYLSIWNTYGRKNIAAYNWNEVLNEEEKLEQWGMLPIFGFEFEF